jgi:hypothetical protein
MRRRVEKYDERECKELNTRNVRNKKDKERRNWKQGEGRITGEANRRRSWSLKIRFLRFETAVVTA